MHPALVTAIAATRRQDQLARVAQARLAHEARPGRPARHRQPASGLRLRAGGPARRPGRPAPEQAPEGWSVTP